MKNLEGWKTKLCFSRTKNKNPDQKLTKEKRKKRRKVRGRKKKKIEALASSPRRPQPLIAASRWCFFTLLPLTHTACDLFVNIIHLLRRHRHRRPPLFYFQVLSRSSIAYLLVSAHNAQHLIFLSIFPLFSLLYMQYYNQPWQCFSSSRIASPCSTFHDVNASSYVMHFSLKSMLFTFTMTLFDDWFILLWFVILVLILISASISSLVFRI